MSLLEMHSVIKSDWGKFTLRLIDYSKKFSWKDNYMKAKFLKFIADVCVCNIVEPLWDYIQKTTNQFHLQTFLIFINPQSGIWRSVLAFSAEVLSDSNYCLKMLKNDLKFAIAYYIISIRFCKRFITRVSYRVCISIWIKGVLSVLLEFYRLEIYESWITLNNVYEYHYNRTLITECLSWMSPTEIDFTSKHLKPVYTNNKKLEFPQISQI